MLYLSRFYPDLRSSNVRRDLSDLYQLHRTLMRAFPNADAGGPGRVLFRVDVARDTHQPFLLVQSTRQPDWNALPRDDRNRSYTTLPPESKPYQPALTEGQRLRFSLRANPVIKRKLDDAVEGKRQALLREEDQIAWLTRKASEGGFAMRNTLVVKEGFQAATKSQHSLTHFAVRFEGTLEVTDQAKFQQTLAAGIGPAKAFGFGLLTIARA